MIIRSSILPKLLSLSLIFATILMIASCGGKNHKSYLSSTDPRRVEILVLGHESEHHNSEKLMMYLETPLFQKGINLTYTTDLNDLNSETLNNYDGLMIYANHDTISSEQESALKSYIEGGKALIPIHSASFCFQNSPWYIETVGGQFSNHGTGDFTAKIVDAAHPVMQGISEFETWDETYVHSQLNPDMHVLMERVDEKGKEPYTWVREQGKGRVFYTAYGHDEKTWEKEQFQNLVANGILWAVGDQVNKQLAEYNIPTPTFEDAVIPNYEKKDPAPRFQHPLSPEESMKLIQVPVGFELELFASEPMIINPMAMAWDERGRLFVFETTDYPNEIRKEGGDDKIKILEDTDGDGKADKMTIFAEGLNIPTSMTMINGGVLISMAPDFIFLKDTDGDDKADVRETIITGWGKSDTHAGPSNLKYGFDNKVWGVLGYSGFNGEVSGVQHNFSQGVYRFNPDGSDLEYLGHTSNNTWGLGFTEDFETFISTANGQHSVYFSMENKYLKRPLYQGSANTVHGIDSHYDMPHITPFLRQVDWHGSYTAAAGHNFYTARSFPESYWNKIAFVAEPTGRVLHKAQINQEGSGYKEKNAFNILASSDEWFAPVHAEVGPDGSLWVADWYNFIIQHNPTPRGFDNGDGNAYINPMRDREHGRIYRLTYKGGEPTKKYNLKDAESDELLAALDSKNMFWRLTAQRLIVETKNMDVLDGLYDIIANKKVDEIGLNGAAVNALWALHGLGVLDGNNAVAQKAVEGALTHPSAAVRKNALRVLPRNSTAAKAILDANLINDADLHTRKYAFLALADMPFSDEVAQKLLAASENEENQKDPYLPQAIFAAVLSHPTAFAQRDSGNATSAAAGTELSLGDRISRSLLAEQYNLDQRNPILFPPDASGKEIDLTMILSKGEKPLQGVLVAQGNNTNGYSVYINKDKLHFAVAQDGKVEIIKSKVDLPEEQFTVNATLTEDGTMTLKMDDAEVAKGKVKGLFTAPLTPENVRIGQNDGGNMVGDYEGTWWFEGKLSNKSSLALKKPGTNLQSEDTATTEANPTVSAAGGSTVKISVIPHEMKFDKTLIKAKAGSQLTIEFVNPDFMQHNLVVGKAGTMEIIGKAADELARNPRGSEQSFVPKIPEVLAATQLVDPDGKQTIVVNIPNEPGEYPFVCTVPGHWRLMNGIIKVE